MQSGSTTSTTYYCFAEQRSSTTASEGVVTARGREGVLQLRGRGVLLLVLVVLLLHIGEGVLQLRGCEVVVLLLHVRDGVLTSTTPSRLPRSSTAPQTLRSAAASPT